LSRFLLPPGSRFDRGFEIADFVCSSKKRVQGTLRPGEFSDQIQRQEQGECNQLGRKPNYISFDSGRLNLAVENSVGRKSPAIADGALRVAAKAFAAL
jgi:hypothetical protein